MLVRRFHRNSPTARKTTGKNTFFDRRLRVTVAGLYVDWTDLQVLVPSATGLVGSVTQNYGGVKPWGGGLKIQAQVASGVSVNSVLAYTSPKFTNGTYDFSAANVNKCRIIATCAPRIVSNVTPPMVVPPSPRSVLTGSCASTSAARKF